ncbi:MAG: hypothetical protein ACI9OJ_000671, partial [Myxococcota bacterium]
MTLFFAFEAYGTSVRVSNPSVTLEPEFSSTFTVTCEGPRSCEAVDVVIRLRAEPSDRSLLSDLAGEDGESAGRGWGVIERESGDWVTREWLDVLEPHDPGASRLLVTGSSDIRFVRTRVDSIAAGESIKVTVPLPVEVPDEAPIVDVTVLGYHHPELLPADFAEPPALSVLLRTIVHFRRTAMAEGHVDGEPFALVLRAGLANGSNVVAVAAGLWLLADLAPKSFMELTADVLSGELGSTFDGRLDEAVELLREGARFEHELAVANVVPGSGPGSALVRLLARAFARVEPPANLTFVRMIASQTHESVSLFLATAATSVLVGVEDAPAELAKAALAAVTERKLCMAAGTVLGLDAAALTRLSASVGSQELRLALLRMCDGNVPMVAMEALGAESGHTRALAFALVVAGGFPALDEVAVMLDRHNEGTDDTISEAALKGDPDLLARLTNRLAGVLSKRHAMPYVERAEQIEFGEGDCLAELEKARTDIHPQLVFDGLLLARCQALRANSVANTGQQAEAEAMVASIDNDFHFDSKVARRILAVRLSAAQRALDSDDLEGAAAIMSAADPHGKSAASQSVF